MSDGMKYEKDRLNHILVYLEQARLGIKKELAVLESKTCRGRFSLCLDCEYINYCPRYHRHSRFEENRK